jgi:hypothetical protein
MMMPMPKSTGVATSSVARRITLLRPTRASLLRPRCEKAFSTTTTEPSTMSPMAMARPPSDIRLADSPTLFITMNVTSGVSTSVTTTMTRRAHVAEEQEQHDDDEG